MFIVCDKKSPTVNLSVLNNFQEAPPKGHLNALKLEIRHGCSKYT